VWGALRALENVKLGCLDKMYMEKNRAFAQVAFKKLQKSAKK